MAFKIRNLKKQFDTIVDFGIKNLVVSGCSFTFNNSDDHMCTWPYYLKDLGNFSQVYDCSLPGAGNHHISHSLQWSLESENLNPDDTLVIVMWSGNNRDDLILPSVAIKPYPFSFRYSSTVCSGISSGLGEGGTLDNNLSDELAKSKNNDSRSIENFLYINSTWHYLKNKNYRFCFLNYASRDDIKNDFEISCAVPLHLKEKYSKMFLNVDPLYNWSVKNNLLSEDLFHPNINGHLEWTRSALIPSLIETLKPT
jgi:hypothetical protein